jgi:hypothetical protein
MILMGAVCVAALGAIPEDGSAQTLPAMAGHSWPNRSDGCFGSSWARMVNNCSSTDLLIVPTQAYAYGWYNNVYARATGSSSGQTNCQALSFYSDGSPTWAWSQVVSTNFSSAVQTLSLGSVWVPTSGTLHFECFVAPNGGQVINVEF